MRMRRLIETTTVSSTASGSLRSARPKTSQTASAHATTRAMLIASRSCTSAATSAARSASASTSTYSPSACAWSPTAPRPSSTGRPSPASTLPSEPPPTAASASGGQAEPAGQLLRPREERRRGSVLEWWDRDASLDVDGGARVDGLRGPRGRPEMRPASDSVRTRTSTCADASAGTVLTAVPAVTSARRHRRPEVGPRERRDGEHLVRELDRSIRTLLRIEPCMRRASRHGESCTARRPCAPSSAHRPRSARARAQPAIPDAVSSISGRAVGDPISSSVVSRTATPSIELERARARKAAGRRPPSCRTRPGRSRARPAASNGQRASVPSGPDGVQMADEQHALAAHRSASAGGRARRRSTRSPTRSEQLAGESRRRPRRTRGMPPGRPSATPLRRARAARRASPAYAREGLVDTLLHPGHRCRFSPLAPHAIRCRSQTSASGGCDSGPCRRRTTRGTI